MLDKQKQRCIKSLFAYTNYIQNICNLDDIGTLTIKVSKLRELFIIWSITQDETINNAVIKKIEFELSRQKQHKRYFFEDENVIRYDIDSELFLTNVKMKVYIHKTRCLQYEN